MLVVDAELGKQALNPVLNSTVYSAAISVFCATGKNLRSAKGKAATCQCV
jgi:hypothetical protein